MKRNGFTLIELIIVLAIISIGFGVSILKFSIVDKIGARNEIRTFVDDYSYLRALALSTGDKHYIRFTSDGYEIDFNKKKDRDLKYIESLNVSKIEFYPNGYVNPKKTKEGHNLVFISQKDPNIKWHFTIEAVGGYLSEKD